MSEVSQKQTYSTWHDVYKTKELSIQMIQIKSINAFGANNTIITKVDWDEIKLTLTNWLLKTMTHYECKFFQIMKTILIFQKTTQISYKMSSNQFSIDSLRLFKDEIHPYSIFSTMVHSVNENNMSSLMIICIKNK
jgi:hypothetical protein